MSYSILMCKYLLFFLKNDSNLSNVTASASFDLEKLKLEIIKTPIKVTAFKYIFLVSSPKTVNVLWRKLNTTFSINMYQILH